MTEDKLWQITSPSFRAWVIFNKGVVIKAALILNEMVGKTEEFVRNYCDKRHWRIYDY